MAAVSFKLSMSSKGGARHVAERFSDVCERCTSGRRCTASVVANGVGGGGSGAFGGGMGGGLRSVRRGLKSAIAWSSRYQCWDVQGKRHRNRGPAYRIEHAPPVLPPRECPPIVLLGANTYPSSSARGIPVGPTSMLPLRARAPGPIRVLR
jgi:hypothetical protein